jgi:hypothetical protein
MKNQIFHILLMGILAMMLQSIGAQNIPENRLVNWSNAGLLEEIPNADLIIDVTDFGATGNGMTDDTEAIQEALAYLDGQAGMLYFPPGTYLLTQTINFHTGLCIKGAGAEFTHLKFTLSSDSFHCLNISASQDADFMEVNDGFYKNSIQLVLMNSSGINPGDFVELQEENGNWDTNPASWAVNAVGQIIEVVAVNGNEIQLKDALRIDYEENLNPVLRKIEPIRDIKIENLSLERIDEPVCGGGKNIYLAYAVNAQISGVESIKSQGSHIYATHSSHLFVFGNYLHDAHIYDGTDTRGYGVTLNMHTGNCLIENNIFKNLRHAMMVKTGANGNVFSYNYSRDPHRSEPIPTYSGDISVHGHYAYANLFEENIVQNLFIDHYWGPGGPNNTFFRNRTELFGIMMTSNNGMETKSQNFIGNEISGNFPYGLYILTGEDHFEFGNNDGGGCVPTNTTDISDESYFYTETPWYLDVSFPTIGYPNELNEHIIPAKERWLNGENLVMEYNLNTVGEEELSRTEQSIHLLQNPVQDQLVVLLDENKETFEYQIYSTQGQLIDSGNSDHYSSQLTIDVAYLNSGTYVLRLLTSSQSEALVFVKR